MACSDECLSLCDSGFIKDLKRLVHRQSITIGMFAGYKIKYIKEHYSIAMDDLLGDVVLMVGAPYNANISVPTAESNVEIGSTISIIQDSEYPVTVVGGEISTFEPHDATSTRRFGSVITLIYEGGDNWRIIGELP